MAISRSYWMIDVLGDNNLHVAGVVQLVRDWWVTDGNGGTNVKELKSKIRVGLNSSGHTSNLSRKKCFAVGLVNLRFFVA